MVSNGEMISLISTKNSYKALTETMTKDTYLKSMLNVLSNCKKKKKNTHSDLPFLPEKMNLGRWQNLVCILHYKEKYVIHMKSLKQALDFRLILKTEHRVIEINQEVWLKP